MNNCVIYDFETLGQDQRKSAVLSLALLSYDESRFTENEYSYDELLNNCKYIKFNVDEQANKYGRSVSKETIDWWLAQGDEARKQLAPSENDESIDTLHAFLMENIDFKTLKKAFTRGNTFDPIFLDSVLENCGTKNPMHWRIIRDTRSMIEGMSYGMNIKNDFMPSALEAKFVKHDPRHDIVMDVMRMQLLARAILTA